MGRRGDPADHHDLLRAQASPDPEGGADWIDEVPLDPGPPHVRIGTRRIEDADWLLPDEHRRSELDLKHRLLSERRAEVVAVAARAADTDRAQAETRELVTAWLRHHRPELSSDQSTGGRGAPGPPSGEHSAPDLEAAARLVQEDLCLMRMVDGPPVLVAAVVCFPSHWRLADKIGQPMDAIHGPVPDYPETLGDRPDRVLEHLSADQIVARRNWSIHDGADLFAPVRPSARDLTEEEVTRSLFLRSERQTLRRLPAGDHVLFTIRVQQTPLGALEPRADVADRLARAIRAEAPGRLDRLCAGQVAPILDWLEGVTA